MEKIIFVIGILVIVSAVVYTIAKVILANVSRAAAKQQTTGHEYHGVDVKPEPEVLPPVSPETVDMLSGVPPRIYFNDTNGFELRSSAQSATTNSVSSTEDFYVKMAVTATGMPRAFNWGLTDRVRLRINGLGSMYEASDYEVVSNQQLTETKAYSIVYAYFRHVDTKLWQIGVGGQKLENTLRFYFSFDGAGTWPQDYMNSGVCYLRSSGAGEE